MGRETWKNNKKLVSKVQAILNRCLRTLLKNKMAIYSQGRRTKHEPIEVKIKRKKMMRHILRKGK